MLAFLYSKILLNISTFMLHIWVWYIKGINGSVNSWFLFSSGRNNISRKIPASKALFLTKGNKIHIFQPSCNFLFFHLLIHGSSFSLTICIKNREKASLRSSVVYAIWTRTGAWEEATTRSDFISISTGYVKYHALILDVVWHECFRRSIFYFYITKMIVS